MAINFKFLQISQFQRDVRLLIIATGIFSISFFGIQQLLRVLYLLRLGYGVEYVGLISATGALSYMTMSIPSGALSSRFGLRRIMLLGGMMTIMGMGMLPLVEYLPEVTHTAWPIMSQMALVGGWAMFSVNMVPAMMAMTLPQNRNQAYAVSGMFRGLGTFTGTIVGGLLPGLFAFLFGLSLDTPDPYRMSLWLGAFLGLAGLIPLYKVSRPVKVSAAETQQSAGGPFPGMLLTLLIIYIFFSHGAWATCQAFCNAYMDTELHLSVAVIGLIAGVGQFAAILSPLLNPRLAMQYGNGWTLSAIPVGFALSLVPIILFPAAWLAAGIGQLGNMALGAMWIPAFQVFQMEIVSSRWRSLAYGIVSMAMGFAFAIVGLVGGYIAAGWGYSSLFLVGVAFSLVGCGVMVFILKRPVFFTPTAELT